MTCIPDCLAIVHWLTVKQLLYQVPLDGLTAISNYIHTCNLVLNCVKSIFIHKHRASSLAYIALKVINKILNLNLNLIGSQFNLIRRVGGGGGVR